MSRQRRRDKGQQLNRTSKRGCRLEDPLRERERGDLAEERSEVGKRQQQGRRAAGRGTCSLLISQVFLADLPLSSLFDLWSYFPAVWGGSSVSAPRRAGSWTVSWRLCLICGGSDWFLGYWVVFWVDTALRFAGAFLGRGEVVAAVCPLVPCAKGLKPSSVC